MCETTVQKIKILYFSATGTTKKIMCTLGNALGEHLSLPVQQYDFTQPKGREEEQRFAADELMVIGVPVYAGRVPDVLL